MNNNKEYANVLEMYAKIIRDANYGLSKEQKELIQKLGDTLIERKDNIIKYNSKIVSVKKETSKKVLETSCFEAKRKNRAEQKNKQISTNTKLAKDIGKEPGE